MNLHPKGIFNDAVIADHGWDRSPKKATLYLWARYETTDEAGVTRDITGQHYLTKNTEDRFMQMLDDMGFTGKSIRDPGLGTGCLRGNKVQITVDHEASKDGSKFYDKVQWVNKNNSEGGASRSTPDDIAQSLDVFDISWKKRLQDGVSTEDSDDVPF